MQSTIPFHIRVQETELRRNSKPVSPNLYLNNVEYFSSFKPRIQREALLDNDATVQAQIDMLGKDNIGTSNGNINLHTGSWTSLSVPYTRPERVALVAYLAEVAFIHDGKSMKFQRSDSTIDWLVYIDWGEGAQSRFEQSTLDASDLMASPYLSVTSDTNVHLSESNKRNKQTLKKIVVGLKSVDEKRGNNFIREWTLWRDAEQIISTKIHLYENLREYLTDRFYAIAWSFTLSLIRFACAFELTDEEEARIAPVLQPLYDITTLVNDYFSWDKEYLYQQKFQHQEPPSNAIGLYMRWQSLSVKEAKAILKCKIVECEEEYCTRRDEFFSQNQAADISPAIVEWLDMLEAVTAGNWLWSSSCPRYILSNRNQYREHFKLRNQNGVHFWNNCTESDDIITYNSGPAAVGRKNEQATRKENTTSPLAF